MTSARERLWTIEHWTQQGRNTVEGNDRGGLRLIAWIIPRHRSALPKVDKKSLSSNSLIPIHKIRETAGELQAAGPDQ
jgi:hypothetical protein